MASFFLDISWLIIFMKMAQKIAEAAVSGDCELEERDIDLGILLLQDNATAHPSQVAMDSATECSFKVLSHL